MRDPNPIHTVLESESAMVLNSWFGLNARERILLCTVWDAEWRVWNDMLARSSRSSGSAYFQDVLEECPRKTDSA